MFPLPPSEKRRFSVSQWVTLLVLLLAALPASTQSFIGCRTVDGNGWEETPMLRKNIHLSKNRIQSGDIHLIVTSLGYHEVYVNGQKVGNRVLQPAVSQLSKRSHNVNYDITPMCTKATTSCCCGSDKAGGAFMARRQRCLQGCSVPGKTAQCEPSPQCRI